jgi:uncharacterized protein YfaT (DUF1175 family)
MKSRALLSAGAAGLAVLAGLFFLPLRHRFTLEVAEGNPVQHLAVESRSLLGLRLKPWGLRLEGGTAWGNGRSGLFIAPAQPGEVIVRAWPGRRQRFAVRPSGDGTERQPLRDEGDREAFRRWFVAILESQLDALSPAWEPAQRDCAGILRFAFREAWAPHDAAWRHRTGFGLAFEGRSPSPSFKGGWGGPWAQAFWTDEGWNPFARGSQLRLHNCVFLGRELASGRPGDLLFFARSGARETPDHAMALVRPDRDGMPMLLYHTGPESPARSVGSEGEVRRVRFDELMQHPNPDFRPHPDNPAFLGVYRWKVLAEEDL